MGEGLVEGRSFYPLSRIYKLLFRRKGTGFSGGCPILLSRKSVRQMLKPTVRIICYSQRGRLLVCIYRPPSRWRIAKPASEVDSARVTFLVGLRYWDRGAAGAPTRMAPSAILGLPRRGRSGNASQGGLPGTRGRILRSAHACHSQNHAWSRRSARSDCGGSARHC